MLDDTKDETLYVFVSVVNENTERKCWVPWTKTLKVGRRIWFQNEKRELFTIKEIGTLKIEKWKLDKTRGYDNNI